MGSSATDSDDPITPAGRLFLQPQLNQIIHCVIGFKNPINVSSIKSQVKSSLMLTHPRFSSLMVRDSHGRERWHKATHIDLDRHVIIFNDPVSPDVDDETAVNDYLADLATSGLPTDKPMWEFHLLIAHNVGIFRIHHALGDGISLMSVFLASCRRADDDEKLPTLASGKSTKGVKKDNNKGLWGLLLGFVAMVWFSLVFVVEFCLRSLWVCDTETEISGGDGVELWPRKLATAKFRLQDMKLVKKAIPNATINDVLFGVISAGISRYLDHRKPNALPEGVQITGVAMTNLREQPGLQELSDLMRSNSGSSWGNKFGMLLLPIYYHNSKSNANPLAYLKRSKVMIDKKKQSVEGHFSYRIGLFVMTYLGPKVATWLNYRILCNTTFTISNILGPQEEITVGGNPITFLRASSSGLPHVPSESLQIALTMHMVSYAERADMQILVAKDIIPDPGFLAKCFEEALLDMKEAAAAITET